jgi:hypothetical protein
MRCAACQCAFCWACMRPGTECGAYDCHHGAAFGNATASSLLEMPQEMADFARGGGGDGGGGGAAERLPRRPQDVVAAFETAARAGGGAALCVAVGGVSQWIGCSILALYGGVAPLCGRPFSVSIWLENGGYVGPVPIFSLGWWLLQVTLSLVWTVLSWLLSMCFALLLLIVLFVCARQHRNQNR